VAPASPVAVSTAPGVPGGDLVFAFFPFAVVLPVSPRSSFVFVSFYSVAAPVAAYVFTALKLIYKIVIDLI
jgi:hypothetical protein